MSSQVFGIIAPHPPIMVPAVGAAQSSATRASSDAMRTAARLLSVFNPDTVVIMSPHAPALGDAFCIETARHVSGSLARFGVPDVALSSAGDPELAQALLARLDAAGVPAIDRADVPGLKSGDLDHGVLVPMSFLDPDGRWPLLVLSLSWLPYRDHEALGREVAAAAQDLGRRIAFVASGDCSHRLTPDAPNGFDPRGPQLDDKLVQLIGASDFDGLSALDPDLVEGAGECGLRSFITLGAAAAPAQGRVLAYEGPWGVGYLTALVNEDAVTSTSGEKGGMAGEDESDIVALARRTIATFVTHGQVVRPEPLEDPALPARAGAFVSLHRDDDLRGCIGTILPTQPTLAEEVVDNAIQAATADPRFRPLGPDELSDLEITVDVLYPPEPCEREDLDPKTYGVIVASGYHRGLLLPDLDGVDTVDDQIAISLRKAGIAPGEPFTLQRFRVDRHS